MPDNNKKEPGKMAGFLVQIKKVLGLNIGTMIFSVLFLYMIFSAILYLTSSHIESYQVTSGPLSRNETYTGLSIREETVCKAESSGYVNYYAREGSKINANGAVYGLSATKIPEAETNLGAEDLSKIRSDMLSFSKGFNPSKFNNTYSFKNQLEGNILQYAGVMTASGDSVQANVVTLGNQNISRTSEDGIILYSRDGYEEKTVDSITAEDFDQNSYHETDLKTDGQVKTGDSVYTIITDERWSLIIPLSDKQAAKLADRTAVRVKFLKDDMTQSGDFSIMEIDGSKYGKIDFNRGLIRYAADRFLDIELVTNTVSGLKIPLSSIVTKEFYTIPSGYSTVNEERQITGFMKVDTNKDGDKVNTFVNATIYAKLEDKTVQKANGDPSYIYFVDKSSFKEGDAIISQSSNEKYIVGETDSLEGVYCINQGYAVFRRIEILDQNEEYAIVSRDTSYGLSRYDHIVKDASQVKEQDILY
ncbi:HlyD family efflux transporter periplasmic adaptor subunit [Ruminococcus sp. 5_1_39BFAA]|uniref:HlyD family efflux transporter periplasmic adaptor subunit n=1 Tax=Ruminococcus sp. 5_1_39BFAA TaxID=457412 RepID=UPI003564289B